MSTLNVPESDPAIPPGRRMIPPEPPLSVTSTPSVESWKLDATFAAPMRISFCPATVTCSSSNVPESV